MVHPLLRPEVRAAVERAVSVHYGRRWTARGFTDLDDRASHPCGIVRGAPDVFAKLSRAASGAEQFALELRGLDLLRTRAGIATPSPVAGGVVGVDGGTLLLFEALPECPPERRGDADWAAIGRTLGTLHRVHGDRYGLADHDGFFGSIRQDNRPVESGSWVDFYVTRRVEPHLRVARDSGYLPADLGRAVERLVRRLPELCGPEPVPALLHGDAQQHNFVSTPGVAVVVDVAPYFGHPELDLALVDYFAPVPAALFDGYREVAHIDPGFAQRRELWRVFCYLAVVGLDGGTDFGRRIRTQFTGALARWR